MKKLIFFLTAAVFSLGITGCTDEEKYGSDGDSVPAVTIYSYAVPAGYNADEDVNLRIVPNSLCTDFYLLAELKEEKAAFIEAEGIDAYTQRVISNGKSYDTTDGVVEVILEDMPAVYAITVVPMNGNLAGQPREHIFTGARWIDLGMVNVSQDLLTPQSGELVTAQVPLQRKDSDKNSYRIQDMLAYTFSDVEQTGAFIPFFLTDDFKPDGIPAGFYPMGFANAQGSFSFYWDLTSGYAQYMSFKIVENGQYVIKSVFAINNEPWNTITVTMDLAPVLQTL